MSKIFTFQFEFVIDGFKYDETEMCAYSEEEAEELFWDFIRDEFGDRKGIKIRDISVVHNEDDLIEYGLEYGTPEEYYSYTSD